jgi:hypothetical protein
MKLKPLGRSPIVSREGLWFQGFKYEYPLFDMIRSISTYGGISRITAHCEFIKTGKRPPLTYRGSRSPADIVREVLERFLGINGPMLIDDFKNLLTVLIDRYGASQCRSLDDMFDGTEVLIVQVNKFTRKKGRIDRYLNFVRVPRLYAYEAAALRKKMREKAKRNNLSKGVTDSLILLSELTYLTKQLKGIEWLN